MDLLEQDILGDHIYHHWYYVSKNAAMMKFIKNLHPVNILDIGAGSGIFSKYLLEYTTAKSATCVDIGYHEDISEVYSHKQINFVRSIDDSDANLVLFMDVIEHIKDDAEFLRAYSKKLQPGTQILITVPAFQFLFSGHDLFLGHERRYSKSKLINTVNEANLELIDMKFFFAFLFPVAVTLRLINKLILRFKKIEPKSSLRKNSSVVNRLLIMVHKLELLIFPYNRFFGLTLFCLVKVPD